MTSAPATTRVSCRSLVALLAVAVFSCGSSADAALVSFFDLEEASAGPLVDGAASPANATQTGSAHLYQQAAIPIGGYGNISLGGDGHGFTAGISSNSGNWAMTGPAKLQNLQNNFTVMAWINPNAVGGTQRIIGHDTGGTGWAFGLSGNRIRVTGLGVVDSTAPAGDITAGEWQHIAMTKSSTSGVTFYLNGVDVGSNAGHTANWIVGASSFRLFNGPAAERFVGLGDQIRVYDTVLSQGEIVTIAGKVPEPTTALLLGFGLMGIAVRRSRSGLNVGQAKTLAALLTVALLACASHAQAYTIATITPTGVTLDAGVSHTFPIGQLIDNSGLSGPPFDGTSTHSSGGSASNSWVTNAPNGAGDYFLISSPGVQPVLTFDLGGTFNLTEANIWNYAQSNGGNQAKDITLTFSTTGTGGPFSNPVFVSLPFDTAGLIEAANFSLDSIAANAVRFTITDNHFGSGGAGGDRIGLGEVKFFSSTTPEPSTALMLVAGLIGLASRRSRNGLRKLPVATLAVALLVVVATATQSQAATFYNGITATSDTFANDLFTANNLVQGAGAGFSATEPHNQIGPTTWVTAANGADYFASLPSPSARLVFDLGGNRYLGEISLWGYADTNANGVRVFDLQFATEADGTSGFGTSVTYNPTFTLSSHLATPRNSFTFDDRLVARYIELVPTDNFRGFGPPGGDRVGLGEVSFLVFNSVPEPSTALLLGVGLVGLVARRRSRVTSF